MTLSGILFAFFLCTPCSRQSDPLPKAPPPPLEYLGEWGVKGEGPGQLSRPLSLATDAFGNVYLADAGSLFIHKFDRLGKPLLSFQDGLLKRPTAIAVDRGGAIYVTDSARRSVLIFLPDGERFREVRGGRGRPFQDPCGVGVDDDGNFFVVEGKGNRVQKFNARGRFVKAWGRRGSGPRRLDSPRDLALGPEGFLYIAGDNYHRIQKFTRDGEFVIAWAANDATPLVGGLAVSRKYVLAGVARGRIAAWTLDGQNERTDDLGDHLGSHVDARLGLAVSQRGELLVLDAAGSRVLRFRINF